MKYLPIEELDWFKIERSLINSAKSSSVRSPQWLHFLSSSLKYNLHRLHFFCFFCFFLHAKLAPTLMYNPLLSIE